MDFEWNKIIPGCVTPDGVATLRCAPALFKLILDFVFSIAGIAALFFVLLAGFKFMTSGGDAKQVEGARKTLTYAIIGLIIIILSYSIIKIIATITGVGCITSFGLIGTCK